MRYPPDDEEPGVRVTCAVDGRRLCFKLNQASLERSLHVCRWRFIAFAGLFGFALGVLALVGWAAFAQAGPLTIAARGTAAFIELLAACWTGCWTLASYRRWRIYLNLVRSARILARIPKMRPAAREALMDQAAAAVRDWYISSKYGL